MRSRFTIVIVILVLILVGALAFAGTTGNIRGKITDIQTNEPLSMVNILIVGSGRGGVSDDKGEYFVMGVTAGTYTVRASLLGYQVFEAKKVRIDADETTVLDFKLASTLIEKAGMTVEGTRPLVDVKKTAGEQTYNKEKIEQLPNVKGVGDVLGLQAGVVKFGQQLFLRGGRANETQILIDGVVVNDVGGSTAATGGQSTNEQLAQLYSGTSTGGSSGALSVAANAIQSVSVSSSGLDAEYGNAQSGVVNITTKSGSDIYSGSLQYRTDGVTDNSLNERYWAGNVGGPEPITKYLLPSLGVDVPGNLTFFASSTFDQSDGAYNFSSQNYYHPLKRKVRFAGFFGDVLNGLGFNYDDKQNNDFSFNLKVSYSTVGDNDQFSYSYRANTTTSHPLYGWYAYLQRYDSSRSTLSLKTQNVFQWTHVLGTNSLIRGYVSRLETDNTESVAGLTPNLYSTPFTSTRDPNEDGFFDIGSNQGWSHANTVIWNAKVSLESKVHDYHFLKTGMEYYTENLRSTTINYPLDTVMANALDPQGDFPIYGRQRFVSNNLPSRGALWLQDNIELTSLTIKLGLRYDFFYLGKQVSSPDYVNTWFQVVNSGLDSAQSSQYFYPEWVDDYNPSTHSFKTRSFWKQVTSGFFSPRLAIGYPISERTVFYFNYGHFLQYPDREFYFTEPNLSTVTDAQTVGNPALKPQKTVQYEAGFDQLLTDDLSLGIRGFYKDVFDYIDSRKTNSSNPVSEWVNLDFASVRGFEVILTKGGGGHYSGSIGYTFQLAKGRSSDPRSGLQSTQLQGLPREVRMSYDQEHTLNLFAAYRVGPTDDYDVFGLNINNWGASVTWNFGSGFPYTPFNFNKGLQDFYLVNSANGPFSSEVDISVYKGFTVLDKLGLVFTLDVINLLNRRNVDMNAGGFNSFTGSVVRYGDYDPSTNPRNIYTWVGASGGQSFYSRVPPYVFRSPRQISLGMKVNWN